MTNKNRRTPNRIPVRFVDGESKGTAEAESSADADAAEGNLTPEEIGRESSYEDETEVRRRVDRGAEREDDAGRAGADDADEAGGPNPSETPERREDQDTNPSHRETAGADPSSQRDAARASGAAESGPVLAELVATRAELKRVEAELQKLSDERQELIETVARRQADFDNYRKRVERERGETYNRLVGEVVAKLLPVLDNLRRALDAESTIQAGESEEFRHFLHGVELIGKQLNGVLDALGVSPVPTVGERFDPHIHEAVATEETDRFEPDTVTEELVRGYRLGEKLIRPAMVKVAIR